jgi:PEGA domain/Tetratricopeptide repeat
MRIPLLIALLALAAPALADEGSDARKAKEAFAAAQKLYKADRYTEAIAKFEEAYAAKPHPVIYFNIARCYEQLGDAPKAIKAYKDYLRLMPQAKDREAVAESIATLEKKVKDKQLAHLTVATDPATARVEIDGKAASGTPATAELPPGTHQVVASLEGYEKAERSFSVTAGQVVDLTVTLHRTSELKTPALTASASSDAPKKDDLSTTTPLTSSAQPAGQLTQSGSEQPRKRVFTWVAGGVAVAGLGAGVALGVLASGESKTLQSTTYPNRAAADAQVGKVQGLATGSNISYGVAAAAAITAVVLFFVEK